MDEFPALRLLIVSHLYPKASRQSAGVFITRQAKLLAKYRVECSFLVPRRWSPWPISRIPRWKKYDLKRDPLAGPPEFPVRTAAYFGPPGAWSLPFTTHRWARAAARVGCQWHREEPFDVVLGVEMTADAMAAARIGRSVGIPVAGLAIGADIMDRINDSSRLRKQLLSFLPDIDLPMGVSRVICNEMEKLGVCKRSPMVTYLARDTAEFFPVEEKAPLRRTLGLEEGRVVAVHCGDLIALKGIAELIEAMRELYGRQLRPQLVCVGDGNLSSDLELLASELGEGSVLLPGRVRPALVAKYLQAADFMVFPSRTEGMPQAVLEAMNCGLPVVGTRVGGIPEAVVDGENGLLVEPRDGRALSVAMERMVVDEEFRREAGRRSLRRVEAVFDPDRNTEKLAGALRSLCRPA